MGKSQQLSCQENVKALFFPASPKFNRAWFIEVAIPVVHATDTHETRDHQHHKSRKLEEKTNLWTHNNLSRCSNRGVPSCSLANH